MLKADFYRACFLHSGWIPSQDLAQTIAIGDVAQIRNGRLQTLLNLQQAHLIETLELSRPLALGDLEWRLEQGVCQSLSETQTLQDDAAKLYFQSRQVLEFSRRGDFLFHAHRGNARYLLNWHLIRDDATLKLTQLHYQFRQAYVVTAVATMHEWGLVIAGQDEARLEMSSANNSCDRYGLLSHQSARADVSRGIAAFEVGQERPAHFFRAKKLILSAATHDRYLSQLVENHAHLRDDELAHWLNADLINLGRSSDLSLNTCAAYFSWCDMSLNDLALLGQ